MSVKYQILTKQPFLRSHNSLQMSICSVEKHLSLDPFWEEEAGRILNIECLVGRRCKICQLFSFSDQILVLSV